MIRITVVVDISKGTIDGFRDVKQASKHLGMSEYKIKSILGSGGVHIAGTKMIGPLNLAKSNRGGNRNK